eukprot:1797419-Amphidinium_carterae.1
MGAIQVLTATKEAQAPLTNCEWFLASSLCTRSIQGIAYRHPWKPKMFCTTAATLAWSASS